MARLGGPLHASWAVARGDRPLADHLADADQSPDRRDYRGADDVIAGIDRRRAQLGLPILLDPRRDPYALRAAELGLPHRGARLARVAAAGGSRASFGNADHVRSGRRTPADRI